MNIIYTGLFAYPDSSANSLRVHGIVQILKDLGHTVTVCGGLPAHSAVQHEENIKQINEYGGGIFSGVSPLRGMFVGDNTIDWLESLAEKPDIIILYGTHLGYLLRLLSFTKRHNIKLILDVVEWYDPRHLPGGLFGPFALMNELSMRFFVKRADGLIVISEYLRAYYDHQKCKTILIPPVFMEDNAHKRLVSLDHESVNLCYVGTPGKKEKFSILLDALVGLYKQNKKFKIHFVGLTKQEFIDNYAFSHADIVNDESYFKFYGRLPNQEAKKIIASCDFMLVFRPDQRFANAGFPSKVPESLSLGTPVFCNTFSDIKKYLINDIDSIIVDNLELDSITNALQKIIDLQGEQYNKMRLSAYKNYLNNFIYKNHSENIKNFILKLT